MRLDITNTRLQKMEINEETSEAGRRQVIQEMGQNKEKGETERGEDIEVKKRGDKTKREAV